MSELLHSIKEAFALTSKAMINFTNKKAGLSTLVSMALSMAEAFRRGNKIMVCGNGGSAAQAMHFAEELTGRYRSDRAALAALSLTDATHITCIGNDYGFDKIFSRAVEAYGKAGDGLLILSTSGNSPNLTQVMRAAKANKIMTYALLGKGGGKLKGQCDFEIIVEGITSDCVQNVHMIIIHCLIESIERELFPENYLAKEILSS